MTAALPATLRTARLVLRPLAGGDEAACVAALGDLETARWLRPVPHPFGPRDFADYLTKTTPGAVWAVTEAGGTKAGRFCGLVGLAPRLGYWLCPEARGRGLIREAARAVLAAHFGERAAPVESYYMLGNDASAAVLRGLGFRPTWRGEVFAEAQGAKVPVQWLELSAEEFAARAP